MPVMTLQDAADRRKHLVQFTKSLMKQDVDYGIIPGTRGKATLLKAGAEKLSTFFGLSVRYVTEEKVLDWTGRDHDSEPFFYFQYKCQLYKGDYIVGEGIGSCTSWEKKYRYRKGERKCPECGKEAIIKGRQEWGGGWLCYGKKGGCGSKFEDGDESIESQNTDQMPNDNPADLVNTIDKMAQKRSHVAAILIAINASEFYTQDMEDYDDGVVEAEFRSVARDEDTQPKQVSQPIAKPVEPVRLADEKLLGVLYGQLKRLGVLGGDKSILVHRIYPEPNYGDITYDISLLKSSEALPPVYMNEYTKMLAEFTEISRDTLKAYMADKFGTANPGKLGAQEQRTLIEWLADRGESEAVVEPEVTEIELVDDTDDIPEPVMRDQKWDGLYRGFAKACGHSEDVIKAWLEASYGPGYETNETIFDEVASMTAAEVGLQVNKYLESQQQTLAI
jgi:hypothetical protein